MSFFGDAFPSAAEIEASSRLDPELVDYLSHQEIPDPSFADIAQCRGLTTFSERLLLKSFPPLPPTLEDFNIDIPSYDASQSTNEAWCVRPRSPPQPGPLIILLHPSGFFLPSHVKVLPHASGLAQLFGATVVAPRYRLAPEHPFPAGVDDAWAAVRWAVKNTAFLKVDLAKGFILGGMSTGSNFAVVLARRAIEEQLPARVTGVWAPLYMGFGPDGEGVPKEYASLCTSREHNKDAIVISGINAKNMYAHLKPDFDSRLFNILSATTPFNMSEFPRTYLQVAGADLFRDDSLILTSALRSHGVEVRLELYPGMPHSFWLWAAHLRQSQKCFRDIVIGFAWLLDVDVETLQEGWQEVLVNMGCVVDMKKAMEELGVTMGGDE